MNGTVFQEGPLSVHMFAEGFQKGNSPMVYAMGTLLSVMAVTVLLPDYVEKLHAEGISVRCHAHKPQTWEMARRPGSSTRSPATTSVG